MAVLCAVCVFRREKTHRVWEDPLLDYKDIRKFFLNYVFLMNRLNVFFCFRKQRKNLEKLVFFWKIGLFLSLFLPMRRKRGLSGSPAATSSSQWLLYALSAWSLARQSRWGTYFFDLPGERKFRLRRGFAVVEPLVRRLPRSAGYRRHTTCISDSPPPPAHHSGCCTHSPHGP